MNKINWSKQNVKEAVSKSTTYRECIHNLGHDNPKGNVKTLKRYIKKYDLDTTHFTHQPNRPTEFREKRSLENILVKNSTYTDNRHLKARLLKQDLLRNECYECGLPPKWNEKELTLQVDHINGESDDNRLENLRLLCPNCHSQTPTFANRDSRNHKCKDCGEPCSPGAKRCSNCYNPSKHFPDLPDKRKFDPDPEELKELVWAKPAYKVGKQFGVSGRAVKKRCDKLGIETPGRGYWQKKRAGKD